MDKRKIKGLLSYTTTPLILEIGAADGEDTLEFISTFSDQEFNLHCYEPDSRNINTFSSRIKDSRVTLHPYALGDITGLQKFYTATKNKQTGQEFLYSNSLRKPAKGLFERWPMFGDMSTFEEREILTVKLDEIFFDHNIDFIWCDVEGCTDLLIDGGIYTFTNKVKYLYTEVFNSEIYENEPTESKILSMLPSYRVIERFTDNILLENLNV